MARRMYEGTLLADCLVDLAETGNPQAGPGYLPDPLPDPLPEVRAGRGGIVVRTRCPDFGKVQLEVWAGDPGARPEGWEIVFDGHLETEGNGFDAGTGGGLVFHVNAARGRYRLRAEARRDSAGRIDGVRFLFPESGDLKGTALP